jgi:Domain of unknown function (DUF4436)
LVCRNAVRGGTAAKRATGFTPIGFWIDISIVLWVIVVLVASMALYIFCWWRQVREDTRKPT